MILSAAEKETYYKQILALSDQSFSGVERPPQGIFRQNYDHGTVFAELKYGNIVGFAIVQKSLYEYFLWSIAVASDMRRHGVATRLLDEIRDFCVQRPILLTCKIDNRAAQRLYLKKGYLFVKRLTKHYDPDDGVLMRRDNYDYSQL